MGVTMDVVRAVDYDVEPYVGPRTELRWLFELAEDSPAQLDSYLHLGRVLVAVCGARVLGHLQIIDRDEPTEAEIKSLAVVPSHRGRGIGRALVGAAVELVRDESRGTLLVSTAAADVGNLRFYQRMGFRMRWIERDAFTAATGYDPPPSVNGIELCDRVWLDLPVQEA